MKNDTLNKLERIAEHIYSLRVGLELDSPEDLALNQAQARVIDIIEELSQNELDEDDPPNPVRAIQDNETDYWDGD